MAKEDILDLLVRRGVNPNRPMPQMRLGLETLGIQNKPNISAGAKSALFDEALNRSPIGGIRTSTVPEQSTIDMLFNKGNQNIINEVNNKSFMDKLAQRARIYGKQAGRALNKEVIPKVNVKDVLGKAKGYAGGPGRILGRGFAGAIAAGELKDAVEDYKRNGLLGATYKGITGSLDAYGALGPAKLHPYYLAAQTGTAPARLIEIIRNQLINQKDKNAYNKNLVADTLKDDGNIMNDLIETGYASIDPKTRVVTFSPEFLEYLGRNNSNQQGTSGGNGGGGNVPPTDSQGYYGGSGGINPGQKTNIQPEASAINSTGTLPQNEQSISGVDLSGINAQYNAANQDYLNKLIEFANNYRQNAINDNRKNLALAMIAKGTHNPYLMQAGKLDNNKQMLEQLKIEEAINEAQLKPLERAQAAIAYAKAGLPAELAYLSNSAMSPFASMYRTDMTRQNVLDQIAARDALQRYINEGRWAMQQMQEEGRNRRQYNDQQFKVSDPYIWSRLLANPGYIYPELPEETQQKIVNYIAGGFSGNPQADANATAKQNVLSKLGIKQDSTSNNNTGKIIPELEVNR